MGNELFDIVNPTHLRSLHDIFSDRNNCATAILDEYTQPITSESNFCSFCLEIRKTKSGLKICRESDVIGMRLARKNFEEIDQLKPVFYKCQYGLVDACAPIVLDDKIMGYLMAGQFRCGPALSIQSDQTVAEHLTKPASEESPKDIFSRLAINHAPKLERLLAEAGQKGDEPIDEALLVRFFDEVPILNFTQFKSFYIELTELTNLITAFVTKLRSWHKPEQAYRFMQGAIGIKTVEDLYNLMVTELPSLFDAVGASIFVVHHDPQKGEHLVLQRTSYPGLKPKEKTACYRKGQGLTGWVWANKRCLRIKNLKNREELNTYQDLEWKGGTHNDSDDHSSFLAVPMFNHTGEVSGVLRLPHKMGNVPFTSDDEIFLRFLADHLSRVIEAQASEDVVQQATGRSGLASAAVELFAAHSRKGILEASLASSAQLFGTTGKMHFVNVLLPGALKWKIQNARGKLDFTGKWKDRIFSINEGLSGKVLRTAIKTKSEEGDIRYDLEKALEEGEYVDVVSNALSGMAAPIRWGEHIYGVIAVASDRQYEFTQEKDLRILESLAVLTGIALHNYEKRRSKIIKMLLFLGRFLWRIVRTRPKAVDDST